VKLLSEIEDYPVTQYTKFDVIWNYKCFEHFSVMGKRFHVISQYHTIIGGGTCVRCHHIITQVSNKHQQQVIATSECI